MFQILMVLSSEQLASMLGLVGWNAMSRTKSLQDLQHVSARHFSSNRESSKVTEAGCQLNGLEIPVAGQSRWLALERANRIHGPDFD